MNHLAHSVGGHFIGPAPNHERIQKHAFIAVGGGRVLTHKPQFMPFALTLWWLLGPWSTTTKGYVKPGYLWRGEPLPQSVFKDWRRWAHKKRYFKDELDAGLMGPSYYDQVKAPIRSWLFSDDPIATQAAADQLLSLYSASETETIMVRPKDRDIKAIGHDGFFRVRSEPVWEEVWRWLSD